MKQPHLNFLVPINKKLTKIEKHQIKYEYYLDLMYKKNSLRFYSELEKLSKVINGK